jgi:hypothetical protein
MRFRDIAWLVVLAAVFAIGIAMWELAPPLSRFAHLIPIVIVVVAWFSYIARRDPVAFASLALPPVLLGALVIPLGYEVRSVVAILVVGWALAFAAGSNRLWAWWSRHVLRRRLPSPGRTFEMAFAPVVRGFMAAMEPTSGDDAADRDRAIELRAALADLVAPDDDWRSLQRDWLALMDDALAIRDAGGDDSGPRRLFDRAADLGARQHELRGRQPEWRGLCPALPSDQVADNNES